MLEFRRRKGGVGRAAGPPRPATTLPLPAKCLRLVLVLAFLAANLLALHSAMPHAFLPEAVDVVYLWVNGSDPAHARALSRALGREDSGALDSNRFRDNSELRFSMRSLERYMPWVRNVYLIVATPTQVPCWLRRDHPRLKLLYHEHIFPNTSHLPSFNSRAIEQHLFRAPGLSPNFIYFNDDFFLLRSTYLSDFINPSTGAHYIYLDENIPSPPASERRKYMYNHFKGALVTANQLLDAHVGDSTEPRYYFRHVPRLLSVRHMAEVHRIFGHALDDTSSHATRSAADVHPLFLYFHYMLAARSSLAEVVPNIASYLTVKYLSLTRETGNLWWELLFLRVYPFFKFLCVNDNSGSEGPSDAADALLRNFLQAKFPHPSSFETDVC